MAEALRARGVAVCILSGSRAVPDLLCSTYSKTWLITISPSRGLSPARARFAATWPGECYLVRTIPDALATILR
jgi:hypothetical protein